MPVVLLCSVTVPVLPHLAHLFSVIRKVVDIELAQRFLCLVLVLHPHSVVEIAVSRVEGCARMRSSIIKGWLHWLVVHNFRPDLAGVLVRCSTQISGPSLLLLAHYWSLLGRLQRVQHTSWRHQVSYLVIATKGRLPHLLCSLNNWRLTRGTLSFWY